MKQSENSEDSGMIILNYISKHYYNFPEITTVNILKFTELYAKRIDFLKQ